MPRVKAITTGSIPSFLDVILNFAESDTTSSLANQDTWLAQIKAKEGGRLVMYGDDTWLKLFPGMFERADGTSSFFVSDFTEVDNNVTRHVPEELNNPDWNAMIMHYLGLDHIGHKAGPLSPNMIPKQREMDGIVQQIYEAMVDKPHLNSTLFILCGDHGMNDGGNHGGSAPGETSPALVFMSPKLRQISKGLPSPTRPAQDYDYYTKIEQSDVAPTIAGLLGLPVPLNNLGVFIREFLPLWNHPSDRVQLLLRNSMQILNIVKATFPSEDYDSLTEENVCDGLASGAHLACLWRRATASIAASIAHRDTDNVDSAETALHRLYEFAKESQDVMSSTASNYNVSRLIMGIAIAAISSFLAASCYHFQDLSFAFADGYFMLTATLYGIMMFASSYVEEEQHFWYWMTGGWLGLLLISRSFYSCAHPQQRSLTWFILPILVAHRIAQRWNQTGQKHAGAPDIVHDWLLSHPILLWILVLLTYATLTVRLTHSFATTMRTGIQAGAICALVLVSPAMVFKLAFTASDAPELVSWLGKGMLKTLQSISLVGSARIVFLLVGFDALWALGVNRGKAGIKSKGAPLLITVHNLLSLFLVTQTRTQNIAIYALFFLQLVCLRCLRLTPTEVSLSTLLLSQASFFMLGNSNAISSIDLSNAYNGVSDYNVLAVGILVFLSNWAGPVWWAIAGLILLVDSDQNQSVSTVFATAGGKTVKRDWISRERERLANAASVASNEQKPSSKQKAVLFPHMALTTLFTSSSLLAVMAACTMLRTHLFIWTVFSPKYLYAMAWSLGYHLFITIGLSYSLWWACT